MSFFVNYLIWIFVNFANKKKLSISKFKIIIFFVKIQKKNFCRVINDNIERQQIIISLHNKTKHQKQKKIYKKIANQY